MNEHEVCSVEESTIENFAATCIYNIIFTNDMACSQIVDLLYRMRKATGISFQAEQASARLEKHMKDYEKNMNKVYSSRASFVADANQVIENAICKDVNSLKDTVKNKFIESGCSNPVLMTSVEIARLFIHIAISGFDKRMQEMNARGIPDSGNLLYLRLFKLSKPIEELFQRLYDGDRINLNNKKSRKAIRSIVKKLTDAKLIAKAINEAKAQNPRNDCFYSSKK